jgi:RNA polymerase sigma-70 factor (ECF subfamily)
MIQYQAGVAPAMDELVWQLSPRLLHFFSGPQWTDAEDVLQECWLRIHNSRHTYLPSEPLLPWIFAIARHTRLDAFRRRMRRGRREVLVDAVPERPVQEQGLGRSPDIMQLLDELPKAQREVLLLLKVSGMSLEEVARATGSSIGAIKQKAHRAYATLRKLLEKGD